MNDRYTEAMEYEANAAYDYHSELWAAEAASMQDEGAYAEMEAMEEAGCPQAEVDAVWAAHCASKPSAPPANWELEAPISGAELRVPV